MQKIKTAILFIPITFVLSCSGKPATKPAEVFDAQKTFAKANELMDKKEYEEARTALLEIKSRDLTKKYAPMAQLRIADSYAKEAEPDRAVEEYRKFLDIYPEHKYASYAQFQIAMIYFNQIEGPDRGYGGASKALEEFERLKRIFPRNPYKDVIEVRIEKCKNTIAEHEFIVGTFYYKQDSYSAAIKRFQGVLQKFPEFKKEAGVLYHLAMSHKKLGEKDKAEEYFKLLIEKHPKNSLIPQAKKELLSIKK
ncbi:MAG: outer membrane protein assembly factor BamD [Thermodesulfovibrionales bacterium]|nr:outer membrane protein assembly factor BamD [Thermodesulfovibrionales bacterium]